MAAGIVYSDAFDVERELYRVDTGYRLSGGFNPASGEVAKLSALTHLPVLCPIVIDFANRAFKVLVNAKVTAAASAAATTLKIAKGSFVKVNDALLVSEGQSVTVSAIDKSNDAYDELTVSALPVAVASGAIVSKATNVKRSIKVVAAANAAATSVKIAKNSGITGACTLSDGTNDIAVSAIDTSRADYDTLTVTALTAALASGAVITDKTASYPQVEGVANALNYARTKIEDGMSITALGRAFEIAEADLYIPLTEDDKASLGARFMFI